MKLRGLLKKLLVNSPMHYSERFDAIWRLTRLRVWLREHHGHRYFGTREGLYEYVARDIIGNRPITFLEFGVYEGASLRTWLRLNTNPESVFVGFDSFEGLPEAWVNPGRTLSEGTFTTKGQLPAIGDSRVRFVKGWFQDTVPGYLDGLDPKEQVVVHCDADLYASTLFVLCQLDRLLKPGVVLLFDDFSSMLHDFRALDDYTRAFRRHYEVLGASGYSYYEQVALRFT